MKILGIFMFILSFILAVVSLVDYKGSYCNLIPSLILVLIGLGCIAFSL